MNAHIRRYALTVTLYLFSTGLSFAGAETGVYLGASVGSADLDVLTDSIDFDDSDTGYKVFAGFNFGWIPLIDISAEAAYMDFGQVAGLPSGNDFGLEVTGVNTSGLVGFKTGPLGFFAKLGFLSWDSEQRLLGIESEDSGTDSSYGLGVRAQLFSAAARLEYESFDIGDTDIGFWSAGVVWTF